MNKSISLSMIVKNEGHNLYTCLNQVKDVVDEIVVVDTGSNDRTPHIAREFGASVYYYQWNDDFSEARNYSLEKCRGDWILILDADEIIDGVGRGNLKKLIDTHEFVAFEFNQFTYLTMDVTPEYRMMNVPRLFPNSGSLKFSGNIRERLVCVDDSRRLKILPANVILWHYGYVDRYHPAQRKYERDLALHLKNLQIRPDNSLEQFFAALNYSFLFRYEDALRHIEPAIKYAIPADTLYYSSFFSLHAGLLIKLKRYEEAVKRCEEAISINPSCGDAWFNLGEALRNLGDYDRAIDSIMKAIENKNTYLFFQDNSRSGWRAYFELSLCYMKKKEYEKSREFLLSALNLKPLYPPLMTALGYIYLETEDLENAEICFYKSFEQEYKREELCRELYKIYKKTGRFDLAGQILEELYKNRKNDFSLLRDMADAFRFAGQNSRAADYYNKCLEIQPEEPELYLYRGVCLFREGFTRKAKEDFSHCMEKNPEILRKVFLEELMFQETAQGRGCHGRRNQC